MAWRTGLMALGLFVAAVAADEAPVVKVMSFNIRFGTAADGDNHWDKRKEFLVETIRAFDPDLLGTQETLPFQRDYLAQKLPAYAVWSAGRDDGKEKGEMAALYWRQQRFEKLDGGHFWLSEHPDQTGSKGWDAALPRVTSWVKLRDRATPNARPILFANTHFDHRGRVARIESARLFRERVEQLGKDCSILITGDFNSGEGSEAYQAMFGERDGKPSVVVDSYRVKQPKRGEAEGTFSAFKADFTSGSRIDWIACSRDWTVRAAAIDRTARNGRTPSDHYPVTAEVKR